MSCMFTPEFSLEFQVSQKWSSGNHFCQTLHLCCLRDLGCSYTAVDHSSADESGASKGLSFA